jgi:hypothetical protein
VRDAAGGAYYDPVLVARRGLAELWAYDIDHDPARLARAVAAGNRLVERVRSKWWFPAERATTAAGQPVAAGWVSSRAQSLALALFVRIYLHTGDLTWHLLADGTYSTLLKARTTTGPWTRVTVGQASWFERFPTARYPVLDPIAVAEGVYALHEYWLLTRNRAALVALQQVTATQLRAALLARRKGDIARMCLGVTCVGPRFLNRERHRLVVVALGQVARITGVHSLTTWRDLYAADLAAASR